MGHIPVAKPSRIPRWSFPRRGLSVAFVLAGFVALIAVVATTAYPTGSKIDDGPRWESVASASDLQVGQPMRAARLWLVKLESGEVIALSHTSQHLGCIIGWRPDFKFEGRTGFFRDLCQGSTFEITGARVYGPAPRDMFRYETRVYGDDVQIYSTADGLILTQPQLGDDRRAP